MCGGGGRANLIFCGLGTGAKTYVDASGANQSSVVGLVGGI